MPKARQVIRRKNMLIDQRKLDAAKAALGEAIHILNK